MFAVALTLLFAALRALASRDNFAYGAEAHELVASLEQHEPPSVALALVEALRDARDLNNVAINGKHAWYMRTVALRRERMIGEVGTACAAEADVS